MIKLLLVEDDPNLRYVVQCGLEDIIGGYNVQTAVNGEEGLKTWASFKPDIIISDIDMPVMDGFEMVRRIRETDANTPSCLPRPSPRPGTYDSATSWA